MEIHRLNELLIEFQKNHSNLQQRLLLAETQNIQYQINVERLEKEKKQNEEYKNWIILQLDNKTKELFESKIQILRDANYSTTLLDNAKEDISSFVSKNSKLKGDLTIIEDQLEEKLKELQLLNDKYSRLLEEKNSQEKLLLMSQV